MRFAITIRRGAEQYRWDFGTKDYTMPSKALVVILLSFGLQCGDVVSIVPAGT